MAGGNRRSLGTKPTRTAALRISTGDNQLVQESAHKARKPQMIPPAPASGTRIPRPSMRGPFGSTGKKGQGQKRSSSSNLARPSLSNMYTTPRSQSSSRTPQHVLKPLSINSNRFSMSGAGPDAQGHQGRGSFVGAKAVKDSRPLNDKAWQKEAVADIVDFLQTHGFPKMLTTQDFPLNNTNFKNVFEFTVNFLIPGFEIGGRRIELELPGLLKKIGYPTAVSKSSFQTLGTMHSWPSVLGVLSYLVKRASAVIFFEEQMHNYAFPNRDEDGFDLGPDTESDDKTIFNHFVTCYTEFNRGKDTFEGELLELERNLMENHGIDPEVLKRLEREKEKCRVQLSELEHVPNRCEKVMHNLQAVKKDLANYKNYAEGTQAYVMKRRREKKELDERNHNLSERLDMLKQGNIELEVACRAKGINPDATDMSYVTDSLQKQIRQQKEMISDQDKANWDLEVKLSKAIELIESKIRNYNHQLMSLEVSEDKTSSDLQLDLSTRPSEVFLPLQDLIKAKRSEERSLHSALERLKIGQEKGKHQRMVIMDELKKLERETDELKAEMCSSAQSNEAEDAKLSSDIQAMKTKLMNLKTNCEANHAGVEGLRGDLDLLRARAEAKAETKAIKAEQGLNFLEQALKKAEDAEKGLRKICDEALEALKARNAQHIEKNEALAAEVKAMVNKYQEEA